MRLGALELLIIFAIILLLFGYKQIPKLSVAVKDAVTDFKSGLKEKDTDEKE